VGGLLAFGWLELVYVNRDQPRTLAVLALGYATVQLVGMALYGIDTWTRRADAFGVYFTLFARMSPLYVEDRELYTRVPLSGLGPAEPVPGTVALVCVLLGITTFDGLSSGLLWTDVAPSLQRVLDDAGLGLEAALEVVLTAGLLASVAFVACFYRLCVNGMRSVAPADHRSSELATGFSHTLVPVALGYLLAHYLTLLISGSQALGYQISDPLADGANLLGTAGWQVNYALLSAGVIWCCQVAFLVAGHIGGLVLAHERALVVFRRRREALRSQYWALTVMVGFTSIGLWLLASASI
jgi:hypothetical protein